MLTLQDLQLSGDATDKSHLELRSSLSIVAHNGSEKHCQHLSSSLKVQCMFAADSDYFKPISFRHVDLRDIAGLVPHNHNEVTIATKQVKKTFWFLSSYKIYVYYTVVY